MNNNITEVSKAVLYQFIFEDYDIQDFKDILEPWMFWKYYGIFNLLMKFPKDEISKNGQLTTKAMDYCSSEKINELITDVIAVHYYSFYLYKDIEAIILNYHTEKDKDDVFKMVEEVKTKNDILTKMQSESEAKKYTLWVLYDKIVVDALELSKRTGITWYKTWISSLDKYTDWLQKGTVMRLTAYSNVGKSKLSYHICNTLLKQWASVLFFSLEVTRERVIHNLMMNFYNKDYMYVSRWDWISAPDVECWDFFSLKLEVVDDMYDLDKIIQYTKNRKPDAIFIDFVQNINTRKSEEYQAMTEVAIKIQQLAISEKIAVFDLSQVSQEQAGRYQVWGKIPSKGSGALVASSDVNLVMERDQDTQHNILHIAKNKFGMNGRAIDLEMDFATNQVYDRGEYIYKNNVKLL